MSVIKKQKTIGMHLLSIFIMLAICLAYFYPQLDGKQIGQDDLKESDGQFRESKLYFEETGTFAFWTNNIYVGQPAFYNGIRYPNPLWNIERILYLNISRPANVFFISSLTIYVTLCLLGASPFIALIGGISFAFTTNNIILYHAGHMMKIGSIMYFPFIISGVLSIVKKRHIIGVLLLSLGLSLSLLHHHIQMIYYLFMTMIIYVIIFTIESFKNKHYKFYLYTSIVVLISVCLAIGANLSRMWTSYEFAPETIRGDRIVELPNSDIQGSNDENSSTGLDWEYATAWSNGILDLFSTIVPRIVGGSSAERVDKGETYNLLRRSGVELTTSDSYKLPLYWGKLPGTSGPNYLGVSVFFLFVLSLYTVKGSFKWWVVLSVILTLIISLGSNADVINKLLYDYLPLYNKFRSPNSVLSITPIFVSLLAFKGLTELEASKGVYKHIHSSFMWVSSILVVILVLGATVFSYIGPNDASISQSQIYSSILDDRKSVLIADCLRSMVYLLLIYLLILTYVKYKGRRIIILGGLLIVVTSDLFGINLRYIQPGDFNKTSNEIITDYYQKRDVDKKIYQLESEGKEYDRGDYRVLDLSINTYNTNKTTYWHNTIGGYTAVKLRRIQDIIDYHLSELNLNVINMLNTKYIINRDEQLIMNDEACGWAWFTEEVTAVNTPQEEIESLYNINTCSTAVYVENEYDSYFSDTDIDASGAVKRTKYNLDDWSYTYTSNHGGVIVFSEMWYKPSKGLKAYLNGEEVEFARVNYMLRAIKVPAGEGLIEFKFEPKSYVYGNIVTQASSWAMILLIPVTFIYLIKRNNEV